MDTSWTRYGNFASLSLLALGATLLLWGFASMLRSYFRLRHVPGPLTSKLTSLWVTWRLRRGYENFRDMGRRLDKEHGPVVQWGANNVLFSDPSVIPVMYATSNIWNKAESYEPAMPMVNGKLQDSLTTTRNEARVTTIKKHINAAFTPRAIGAYESHVDEGLALLNARLVENAPDVDLVRWLKIFAFESICRIAFSDLDFTEQDMERALNGARERFTHWYRWFANPGLEALIYKNPFIRARSGTSLLGQQALDRVNKRKLKGAADSKADLLQWYLESNEKSPHLIDQETVVGLVISTINAGAETTATTILETLQLLLKNPSRHAILVAELESAGLASPPSFESVSRLPYLDATIKEAMRLNPVNQAPLERQVPPGGATLAGVYIPGGTSVALNTAALGLREDVWGEKADEFRPERWTQADPVQKTKMDRVFYGFGHGKRMCIGQHIAWLEMKKGLADLLLNYEMKLSYPAREMEYWTTIVSLPKELWVSIQPRQRGGSQ